MTIIFAQEKPSIDEVLAHHGIKGMHWGVRKENPYASTESRGLRREATKAVRSHMWNAIKDEPMFERMTKEEYDSLSKRGETFAAGMKLTRIAKADNHKLEAGALYVSKMQADHDFYKAVVPATKMDGKLGAFVKPGQKNYKTPSYEQVLKTTHKLTLPSDKERVDAFMDILSTPSIKLPGKDAPITGRKYLEKNGYDLAFKKKTDQEAAFLSYHDMLRAQGDQSSPLNQAYFDRLRAKGYNAVVDSNDAGRYTTKPLIILNADKTVKTTSIRRLSADEINQAQRALTTRVSPGAAAGLEAARVRRENKAAKKAAKATSKGGGD